jgi:urease accessory protein
LSSVAPLAPDALVAEGTDARGWEAAIDLGFVARDGATICERRSQRGPLVVQRPFTPEGPEVSHVTLLHPPGGLVGGDHLHVSVEVAGGAHALLTTPAAAKHYRSRGATARQEQRFTVAAGGALEWLPHETILYDGAISSLSTRVELAPGARFIGVDLVCFGLPARSEPFARGRCRQRFELWSGDQPLLLERGDFDGGAPVHAARWGLAGAPVMGLLLATPASSAASREVLDAIRARATELPAGDLGSATRLEPGILVVRYLGGSSERAAHFLRDAWRLLRPALLGRAAVNPRIWST